MPPELSLRLAAAGEESAWRAALIQLAIASVGLFALTIGDWSEMAWQWWNSSTCNHILFVPPILAWLVWLRVPELAKLRPAAWWPGLAWFAGGVLLQVVGSAGGISLLAQLGAVAMLQGAVVSLLGPRVAAGLLFPLGYMIFLVPFGDEIVPPLQRLTADMAVALTHLSGVPASIHGVLIDTPVGRFEVAEACSGVKFLIAMIALGTLVAHLGFRSAKRRAIFITACVIVPVLANGVRAWGTIYVAQFRGVAFAAGFDHIVYGWIFFAIVMGGLLGLSWRFFDRAADDKLVDVRAIEASPVLARLDRYAASGRLVLACLLASVVLSATWGVALARPLVEGLLAALGAPS
jgi:exosortase A